MPSPTAGKITAEGIATMNEIMTLSGVKLASPGAAVIQFVNALSRT